MTTEAIKPNKVPLRLAYFDPKSGLRQFVEDGQGKRMYGLSGQAFLRAVVERETAKKPPTILHHTGSEEPALSSTISSAEKRRRKRYGEKYLDQQVKTADGRVITRAEKLMERVDQYSAAAIAETYRISEAQAGDFYERRLENANGFVVNHIETLFPNLMETVGLTNDVSLVTPRRSALLSQFVDNPDDIHLHFETQRQLVLAELSAELSERSRAFNLKGEVKEVQRYLTKNLFSGVDFHTVYGVYDEEQNRLVAFHTDTPPAEVPSGHFVAEIEKRMRQIPITETYIDELGQEREREIGTETAMCDVRTKPRPSEMRKALRRAELRKRQGKGDYIDVHEDVLDSVGLMFVVKGAMDSHNSPEVDRVVTQVKKVMEKNKTRWGQVQFVNDFETNNDGSQSSKQRYQRYQVFVENLPLPFELIFYAQGDYQNSQDEVGKRQATNTFVGPERGKTITQNQYTGRAHDLYKITQALDVNDHILPPALPFYNGKRDLRKIAQQHMDEIAEQIRTRVQKRRISG